MAICKNSLLEERQLLECCKALHTYKTKSENMASVPQLTLYSYYRSSCSYRVRIALNLKNIEYEIQGVNLLQKGQLTDDYQAINPAKQVPSLIDAENNQTLTQSLVILEYIEEMFPNNQVKLLPTKPQERRKVREICETIGSIQTLQNMAVLLHLESLSEALPADTKQKWAKHFIEKGFKTVETLLDKYAGKFCVNDELSLADCFLVPQVYNAKRYQVDLSQFPHISKLNDALTKIPAFENAAPKNQPDCPEEMRSVV